MPIPLPLTIRRIDVGEPLPSGTDAVLPLDAVALRDHRAEAIAPAVAGEGVLAAAADVTAHAPLRRAGERVRAIDLAVMRAAGIGEVNLRRRKSTSCGAAMPGRSRSRRRWQRLCALPPKPAASSPATRSRSSRRSAIRDDAVIAVGGTGSGRRDAAVANFGAAWPASRCMASPYRPARPRRSDHGDAAGVAGPGAIDAALASGF